MPTLPALGLPGRRDGREVFPHGLDHSPPPDPETGTDTNSSVKQQPDGGRCLLQDGALLVNQPQGYQGTDGVTGREKEVVTQMSSARCTAGGGSPGWRKAHRTVFVDFPQDRNDEFVLLW